MLPAPRCGGETVEAAGAGLAFGGGEEAGADAPAAMVGRDEQEVDLGGGAGLVQAEVTGEAAVLAAPGEGEGARGAEGLMGGGVERGRGVGDEGGVLGDLDEADGVGQGRAVGAGAAAEPPDPEGVDGGGDQKDEEPAEGPGGGGEVGAEGVAGGKDLRGEGGKGGCGEDVAPMCRGVRGGGARGGARRRR